MTTLTKTSANKFRFRAWYAGNMYYNISVGGFDETVPSTFSAEGGWVELWGNNKDGIIMQSTGLLDKNGKEIYEGDIVRCPRQWWSFEDAYHVSAVEWGEGCFKIFSCGDWSVDPRDVMIIGNIYENPNLIPSSL